MSAQKWTPGPWRSEGGLSTGRQVVAPSQPKSRYRVAGCGGSNRDANARLIAAAPSLFDALELVERLLVGVECTDYPVSNELSAVRAAIALATGETP